MALVSRFEDIQGWQEARKLVRMVYLLTDIGKFSKDFGLRDQIRRAAVSAMSNIAEEQCKEYYEQARKTKALIGGFKRSLK